VILIAVSRFPCYPRAVLISYSVLGCRASHKLDCHQHLISICRSRGVRLYTEYLGFFIDLGHVRSVTLPPILLSPYIQQQGEKSTPTLGEPDYHGCWKIYSSFGTVLAAIRGLMISVGILAALTVNTLLFPRHCRVRV